MKHQKEIMRVNADIPYSLYQEFKKKLVDDRKEIKQFLTEAIEKYILKK